MRSVNRGIQELARVSSGAVMAGPRSDPTSQKQIVHCGTVNYMANRARLMYEAFVGF